MLASAAVTLPLRSTAAIPAALSSASTRAIPTALYGRISAPRAVPRAQRALVRAQASDEGSSTAEIAGAVGGLISVPVVAWSLFTLKTTGCGLPPGPGGSLGALEGVAYLAIVGLVGWSAYTKATTGKGLPNGPYGLLGAAEGLAYLTLVAAVVVFGLQLLDYGYIPPPVPGEQCFG
ncbi:hypothetical protein CLOM_g10293 [Closterium sp. NIES-68]|nr:hypothetical protein CLOM_g10293 [Closterium sp. NIES-68]GJP78142.1 hypothetical protein CLOP_g8475 [Closterium sp. NIES-67]